MKKFFNELKQRWTLPSPEFFKKIIRFGSVMASIGLLILVPENPAVPVPQLFPESLVQLASYMFVVGSFIAGVAKLAVVDTTQIEPPKEPNTTIEQD